MRLMVKLYLAFSFLTINTSYVFAQSIQLDVVRYNTTNGLSNSCVYDIYQDDNTGLLWIATEYGLNKFDGKKFTVYDSKNGSNDNIFIGITQTRQGKMLFSTFAGGLYELISQNSLTSVNKLNNAPSVFLCAEKKFSVVTLYNSDLKFPCLINGYFPLRNKLSKKSFVEEYVNGFLSDTLNPLLIAKNEGVYELDMGLKTKLIIPFFDKKKIQAIGKYTPHIIYASSQNVIYQYDRLHHKVIDSITICPDKNMVCKFLFTDSKQRIWVYSENTKQLFLIKKNGNKHESLLLNDIIDIGKTNINKIIEDNEGNIWIAVYNKGLYCIKNSFIAHDKQLNNHYLNSVYIDSSGNYFMGSSNALHIKTAQHKVFKIIDESVPTNYIYGAVEFKNKIYIKTNHEYNFFKTIRNSGFDFVWTLARDLAFYKDSFIVEGVWDNDICIRKLNNYKDIFGLIFSIKKEHNRVNKIVLKKNIAWCGTNYGLYMMNIDTRKQVPLPNNQVITNQINDILIDNHEKIWLGSVNALITSDGNSWKTIHAMSGHSISKITSLATDDKRIFIATLTGLFIISENDTLFIDGNSGLNSSEINAIAYDKKNNLLALVSNIGLSQLDLDVFDKYKPKSMKVLINGIEAKDKPTELSLNSYYFKTSPDKINVSFVAVNHTYPFSVTYKYQIDDASEQYTTENNLEIANLNYGNHTIKVYGGLNYKYWGLPTIIKLTIKTPFYYTWWFIVIVTIVILFCTFFSVKKIVQNHKLKLTKENDIQKTIADLKHKALSSAINPHFVFNGLNSLQHYVNSSNKPQALSFIGKFARLMRLILDHADASTITISDELEQLNYYLEIEKMRFKIKFDYSISVQEDLDKSFEIPNMIIQPFVENAVLHAFHHIDMGGMIKIEFKKMSDTLLKITIEDNGSGINQPFKKEGHKSYAINNIKQRLLYYPNTSIEILDKSITSSQTGTLVTLIISITK